MEIKSTAFPIQQNFNAPANLTAPSQEEQEVPKESFVFSGGSTTAGEKLQIGTIAAAGALIGAVPVFGAGSNAIAAAANNGDELGQVIASAGVATNLIASLTLMDTGLGLWPMAIPATLGAIAWGGYAAQRAKS